MNNILKAARLDFSLVKPYIWNMVFPMLFPVIFSLMNTSLVYGVSFTMCFIGMTASYTFEVSEKNGMERLYAILPIPRKHMVLGRYLYTCTLGLTALLITLIVHPIVFRLVLGIVVTVEDIITAALTGIIMFTVYTALLLPSYYKFGTVKGRLFMFVPLAGYIAVVFLSLDIDFEKVPAISAVLENPAVFITVTLLMCMLAYAVSIAVSVHILKNKDV